MIHNRNTSLLGIAVAVCLLALWAPSASADTIFDNFGAGDSYTQGSGWTVAGGASGISDIDSAMAFVPSITLQLDSITAAITLASGTNQVFVDLVADSGGTPGTTVLESWVFVNAMADFTTSSNSPISAASVSRPLLGAGITYWLVASLPASSNTHAPWNFNNIGSTGLLAQRFGSASWNTFSGSSLGAFRIEGSEGTGDQTIPEPATAVLIAVGAIAAAGVRRRRR